MGNNDVKGKLSGNVFCTDCLDPTYLQDENINCAALAIEEPARDDLECYVQAKDNAEIDGEIVIGPIDIPPVPTPPDLSYASPPPSITEPTTIVGGSENSSELLDGACVVDSPLPNAKPVTHCVVDYILLDGNNKQTLTVDTSNGPVRIYVTGSSGSPKYYAAAFLGNAAIIHLPEDSKAVDLSLFGRPVDPTDTYEDQVVILSGGATTAKLWAFFPDGDVGINGGSSDPALCDADGECTGGDIEGAMWAKTWGGVIGSASNQAQLVVPPDIGTQFFNNFGGEYALGIRDYVAIGVSQWRSFWKASGN
jgi:hypothetical protein